MILLVLVTGVRSYDDVFGDQVKKDSSVFNHQQWSVSIVCVSAMTGWQAQLRDTENRSRNPLVNV